MGPQHLARAGGVRAVADAGALEPLGNDLSPEARTLASELRMLFAGLEVSMTRYAIRVFRDKSVVSRYLSGKQIPDWGFIHDLLVHSTLNRDGTPPTQDVVGHLKRLHLAALRAGSSPHYQIVLLREQLFEADAAAGRATRRVHELEQALEAAQSRLAEMEIGFRELGYAVDFQQAQHAAELEHYQGQAEDEREALLAVIARLKAELEEAHRRRQAAEARAAELERRLEQIEDERESNKFESDLVAAVLEYSGRVAAALIRMDPEQAADALNHMDLDRAATLLDFMIPDQAAALNYMDPARAATLLNHMNPDRAVVALSHVRSDQADAIQDRMSPSQDAAASYPDLRELD